MAAQQQQLQQSTMLTLPTRTITLEEHAAFPAMGADSDFYRGMWAKFPRALERLQDHGAGRIADMDAANVSMQVLSYIPGIGISDPAGCTKANNQISGAVADNPKRFAGFAVLPMAFPKQAADELERSVMEIGLVGALIDNHLPDGTHYDGEEFWPFWEVAERLRVPIYVHPAPPATEGAAAQAFTKRFAGAGGYSGAQAIGLATGAWGWHEDCGLHFLKLCAAGLFDRFPHVRIVLGHMGEMVPFMLDRADRLSLFRLGEDRKSLRRIWDENVWITTSGMFSLAPLAAALRTTKVERIMYSIDYPFEDINMGWRYLEEVARSGLVDQEELEMIAWKNAANLLAPRLR